MSELAGKVASKASLQALGNCYLREVDPGVWHSRESWQSRTGMALSEAEQHVVELNLEASQAALALGVAYRSLVGRHTLTTAFRRSSPLAAWRRIDDMSAVLLLVDALYADEPSDEERLELIGRIIESRQVMGAYLADWGHRLAQGGEASERGGSFIESEQSVLLGHWLHPTPKSRQGIHAWQHAHYAPEMKPRFQLHFFAARRGWVRQGSIADRPAELISRELAEGGGGPEAERVGDLLARGYCALPVHPLQAHWLLHQAHVLDLLKAGDLVDLGRLGPEFTPTSSVRTLYAEDQDFMVKLSIPVKITNSLRINLSSELGDSLWVSQLLRTCSSKREFPGLRPIEDPAYISLSIPGLEQTGFEAIFRQNLFKSAEGASAPNVQSIAALVQEPLPGRSCSRLAALVQTFATRQRLGLGAGSLAWFEAYFRHAIEPALRLYDTYGVALEAHQQNVLLGLDPFGQPVCCYYRDVQGLAVAESFRAASIARVPELEGQPKVFEADELVRNGLGYYLFFNQLHSVINRLGLDGLLDEDVALALVRRRLLELRAGMGSLGRQFIDVFCERQFIACKSNLLTRARDLDELEQENELGVYGAMYNHLARGSHSESSGWSRSSVVAGEAHLG